MALDIRWGQPYKVYSGPLVQWRREWCIPPEYLSGFFEFWKKHKFKMLADGFTVTKSKANNKWYFFETKDAIGQFKSFGSQETEVPYVEPHPGFILPEYHIKDTKGLRPWQGKIRNLVKVAYKSIVKNRMRSFLTMLGIIIGVGAVIALVAIGQGTSAEVQKQISSLGSNLIMVMPGSSHFGGVSRGAGSEKTLTLKDVEKIKKEAE